MKMKSLLLSLALGLIGSAAFAADFIPQNNSEFLNAPPVVLQVSPTPGDAQVDPNLKEITVTFNRDMQTDRMWSVVRTSVETFPEVGTPRFTDKRTFALPVSLQPGRTYILWFNKGNYNNFRGVNGAPAVDYLLVFQTKRN